MVFGRLKRSFEQIYRAFQDTYSKWWIERHGAYYSSHKKDAAPVWQRCLIQVIKLIEQTLLAVKPFAERQQMPWGEVDA